MTLKTPFVCLVALWLVGCTLGPDYQRPASPLPAGYKHLEGWSPVSALEPLADAHWWARYQDTELATLIAEIDAANQTLAQAEARWRQAQSVLASSRAQAWPGVSAQTGVTRSGTAASVAERYSLTLAASWLPDLWGRVRRETEASRADVQARAADLAGARLAAQSALARAYFRVRVIDQQQRLLTATHAAYERSLALTRNQYAVGIAARADVVLAETQLAQVRVQQQDLHWQRAQQAHAIAVLLGKTPADFALTARPGLPSLPPLPTALPIALLTRRPDVAAGEQAMVAANARIGVARAAWLPDLSLAASGGYQGLRAADWLSAPFRLWSLGPVLAATVFDGGARSAAQARAQAVYDEQVARWRQTVLEAVREVEDALVLLRVLESEVTEQARLVALAEENERLVTHRYQAGIVSYLEVAVAQNTTLNARRSLLATEGTRLDASVALLAALGGGWGGLDEADD